MNKVEEKKLLQVLENNKNVCIFIGDFLDIIKEKHLSETVSVWDTFKETTDRDILYTGLYGKYGETNIYCSSIVGPGNVRVAKVSTPVLKMSQLRKDGDEHVGRTIAENWSEEIILATYGEE